MVGETAGKAMGGLIEALIEGLSNSANRWEEEKRNRRMLAYAGLTCANLVTLLAAS